MLTPIRVYFYQNTSYSIPKVIICSYYLRNSYLMKEYVDVGDTEVRANLTIDCYQALIPSATEISQDLLDLSIHYS